MEEGVGLELVWVIRGMWYVFAVKVWSRLCGTDIMPNVWLLRCPGRDLALGHAWLGDPKRIRLILMLIRRLVCHVTKGGERKIGVTCQTKR